MRSVFLSLLLLPNLAAACGGFFCSSVQLVPVEQNQERILFEVDGSGIVSTTVEIRYVGAPSDFSWVVPVPETPTLTADVPAQALALLDSVTQPRPINVPGCPFDDSDGCAPSGCGEATLMALPGASERDGAGAQDAINDVVVEELPQVGPYEPTVVSSDDPEALAQWLRDNNYLITPEMEPAIASYVAAGDKFLAMKLAPGMDTADISPITMTFADDEPMIPIVLTGVSAEPEMGILVFFAAPQRYQAKNFGNLLVDAAEVRADQLTGTTNYYPLVSHLVDQEGGHAFITEMSGDLQAAVDAAAGNFAFDGEFSDDSSWLSDLADRQPMLTRLYTRLSGWEMTSDPSFEPSQGGDVSNQLDLSAQTVGFCDSTPECGTTYCGPSATCGQTEGGIPGCVCPQGTVARLISAPQLLGLPSTPTIMCQDATLDMMASLDTLGIAAADPCETVDCGSGSCQALGGFPTCRCDPGAVAVPGPSNPTCVAVLSEVGPAEGLSWGSTGTEPTAINSRGLGGGGLALAVMLLPALLRRRIR